jgi:glycosyltransferase involved in cell wall biosynthesis
MVTRQVLLLAYHFPPLGGGGVQRTAKFVRYLPQLGYDCVVVTGPGGASDRWTPEDRTLLSEIPEGTEVVRVPGPEPARSSGPRRRAEQLLGMREPFDRWWVEGAIAAGRRAGKGADVIVGELVPYVTASAAARLARSLGKPWVADLQDPWALDEMWLYPTGLHRFRDRERMRSLLGSAAAIVMNTPEAVERLRASFPELAEKPIVSVPNGFDPADFAEAPPERRDGAFRIVHAGYLHTDLGLRHRRTGRLRRLAGGMPVPGTDILTRSHVFLLEAVGRLIEADPKLRSQIEVHLAGPLSEADRRVAERSPVVHLHGYISHAETVALMRTADLLFLPMQDLPPGTRAGLVPGKTYEYLAAARPILAAVPDGDARDILAEAGNAFLCRPGDAAGMASAIAWQLESWRGGAEASAPRAEVVERYERRRLTGELAEVLDLVLFSPLTAPPARQYAQTTAGP